MRMQGCARRALRGWSAALIVLGVLAVSTGIAVVVSPASAVATKVGVCHATSSDSNPYEFLSVDDDSVKFQGHLGHRNEPNKTWQNDGDFEGVHHVAGQSKPDLIGSFTDDGGVFHLYDGTITEASCDGVVPAGLVTATASVVFTDPSCVNGNEASYATSGEHVSFAVTSGSAVPGGDVVVTATADAGAQFADASTSREFSHHFGDALDLTGPPCVETPPAGPVTATASVVFTDPSCVNGNEASYATSGEHVSFAVTSGSAVPGGDVVVTATADAGAQFADASTSREFSHHFGDALDLTGPPCVETPPAGPVTATASVVFTDPSCVNGNEASYATSGEHVSFAVTSGSAVPGGDVVVTATADAGAQFADASTSREFSHHFGDALDLTGPPCVETPPAEVVPAAPTFSEPTCEGDGTVVALDTEQVVYVVTGGAGAGETAVVDASAVPPAVLADGATTHWEHSFAQPEGCITVEPPVVEPPVVDPPGVDPPGVAGPDTPTVSVPTVVDAGLVPPVRGSAGTRGPAFLGVGIGLIAIGLAAGAVGRSRGSRSHR